MPGQTRPFGPTIVPATGGVPTWIDRSQELRAGTLSHGVGERVRPRSRKARVELFPVTPLPDQRPPERIL